MTHEQVINWLNKNKGTINVSQFAANIMMKPTFLYACMRRQPSKTRHQRPVQIPRLKVPLAAEEIRKIREKLR